MLGDVRGVGTGSVLASDPALSTPNLQDIREKTGRSVYELFASLYLTHHMTNLEGPRGGQTKVICPLAPMHHEMCGAYETKPRCLLVAPAKFAKSTWTSFFQPLTDGVLGLVDGNILLISNTGRLAEHWLGLIKEEIETNKDLIEDYGDLKGSIWRHDHIKLKTGIEIVSLGLNYQIRGTGWGKVIGDDMEDDDMVRSQEQREKFSDWWDGAMMGRMHPHTSVVVIGTFLHPLCKIKKMFENADGQYDAWWKKKFQALDEKGESTWPERWPTDVILTQRQEMGEKAFLAEKMNEPIFGQDHIIRPEQIQRYDKLPSNLFVVTGFDSSSGIAKEVGDYAGHMTWGLEWDEKDPPGRYYCLSIDHGKWGLYDKVRVLFDRDDVYNPSVNLIENDAYGKELSEAIKKESERRQKPLPMRRVVPDKNKARRLMAVEDLFQQGKVLFPRQGADRAVDQLLQFSSIHESDNDEYVDVTSMVLNFLRRQRKRVHQNPVNWARAKQKRPNKAGRLV